MIQRKRYGDIIDRAEGLRAYAYRYLKKPDTRRSYYFIRMLLELPEAAFHKEAVKRKAERHFSKLKEIEIDQVALNREDSKRIFAVAKYWTGQADSKDEVMQLVKSS